MPNFMTQTWAAVALLSVAYFCLTALVLANSITVDRAIDIASGVTFGALAAWKRGDSADSNPPTREG